ncbi:hypothetical protein FA95DRAFT_1676047 [Auriscalpium vulgare]|uniref:Uncharacterized protein n=1 Tax=Auriscalpium vulgare TaxID=40419 RepID=A0ACB8S599_9AGAM|nr:hypothetical protein FA95DRAFT_1676047 [Auriscalpium vulgare]
MPSSSPAASRRTIIASGDAPITHRVFAKSAPRWTSQNAYVYRRSMRVAHTVDVQRLLCIVRSKLLITFGDAIKASTSHPLVSRVGCEVGLAGESWSCTIDGPRIQNTRRTYEVEVRYVASAVLSQARDPRSPVQSTPGCAPHEECLGEKMHVEDYPDDSCEIYQSACVGPLRTDCHCSPCLYPR